MREPVSISQEPADRSDRDEVRPDVDDADRSRRLRTDLGRSGPGAVLWNKETRTFISYEDPESLRLKAAYILEKGLAGAMFWRIDNDRTGVLLDTLFRSLHGSSRPLTSPGRDKPSP